MQLGNQFIEALKDYQLLLDKKYPQKSILKIICDKYQLSGTERSILYRGISHFKSAKNRRGKKLAAAKRVDQTIHIDTYNQLIIIGSYLNGSLVFIGTDGYLRDAAEVHGKNFRKKLLDRARELLFEYLQIIKPKEIKFYIDEPISFSGDLANQIRSSLKECKINGAAETFDSPDHILKKQRNGVIATSDSAIIDNSELQIFDLAFNTLKFHFDPDFLDLTKI